MAVPADLAAVQQALAICGATAQEIQVLTVGEGLDSLREFGLLTKENVDSLATKLERRTIANGRLILSTRLIKNVQALCFWMKQKMHAREVLDPNLFDAVALFDAREAMNLADEKADKPDIKPDKFKADKWYDFSKAFPLYLSHHKGEQGAKLDYVIRPDVPPGHVHANQTEVQRYSYPHTGRLYQEDNKTVYRMLADLVNGTEGFTWIEDHNSAQNGREAWLALQDHYDGGGNREKVIARAESIIDNLHYKNEQTFTFEKFSAKYIGACRDLRRHGRGKTPYEEVKDLLEKIQINHARVEVIKNHVRENFREDLNGTVEYLSTQFAEMFPSATFNTGRQYRNIHEAQRGGNEPNRRGRQQPTQGVNGTLVLYGVDVTNVGRTFTRDEMTRLGREGRSFVFSERQRLGLSRQNPSPGQGQAPARGSDIRQPDQRDIRAAGMEHAPGQNNPAVDLPPPPAHIPPPAAPPVPQDNNNGNRGPNNGNRFGAGRFRE